MIVTERDARKIIHAAYGDELRIRILSKSATIGVRPVYDPRPSLVWIRLMPGADSAVKIGRLLPGGDIDWSYDPTSP